jgi:protein-S-isoprenylcysteine O-methyltransferase Ste14
VRYLELRIPPLALWAVFAVAVVALAHFVPDGNLAFPGSRAVSVAALVAGVAVAVAGVIQFRRAKTTVNPLAPSRATTVVASGVYRFSRNPMYLGMAAALLGVAAWSSTLLGYILVPVFCAYMTRFQIKPEEQALLAAFGDEFERYMRQVRRWV